MRKTLQNLAVIAALALGACTSAAPPATAPVEPVEPVAVARAPAREVPPPDAADPKADGAGTVDFSCTTDADCAVKDVGNCCGYYPACVNVDSPTFPERVKAQCAKEGMNSVCGFPVIESCVCKAGRCEAGPSALQVE